MEAFTTIRSRVIPLVVDDVDTDQIIPARYLKITDRDGLAEGLFAEWRKDPEFALNDPKNEGVQILLSGSNFGSGSSREHAPWALMAGGFRCIVARSFADIFHNNALKNGLLPVTLEDEDHAALLAAREADPALAVDVDLPSQTISWGDHVAKFPIAPFPKRCMLEGIDSLDYLRAQLPTVESYESTRGW